MSYLVNQACENLKICQLAFTDINYQGYVFICLREAATLYGYESLEDNSWYCSDSYYDNGVIDYRIYNFHLYQVDPDAYYTNAPSPFSINEPPAYNCGLP
ncbi:hypothetical protein PIROE2DRAFT_18530 [Piromyces sp. E2]|nr:hypothetical protein PIROE2DRAFT_18530 [Piromyces sp. E2]|eukprot:OUM56730.1 hypothetical protein PIROE2DRAFT_18530 [Piromyces sp. E2]